MCNCSDYIYRYPYLQTKNLIGEGIEEQTDQALKNLGAILEEAGSSFSKVLKTTVYLMDMADFGKVNKVYGKLTPFLPSFYLTRTCFHANAVQQYILLCSCCSCKIRCCDDIDGAVFNDCPQG